MNVTASLLLLALAADGGGDAQSLYEQGKQALVAKDSAKAIEEATRALLDLEVFSAVEIAPELDEPPPPSRVVPLRVAATHAVAATSRTRPEARISRPTSPRRPTAATSSEAATSTRATTAAARRAGSRGGSTASFEVVIGAWRLSVASATGPDAVPSRRAWHNGAARLEADGRSHARPGTHRSRLDRTRSW